jgi:hypothetical protein
MSVGIGSRYSEKAVIYLDVWESLRLSSHVISFNAGFETDAKVSWSVSTDSDVQGILGPKTSDYRERHDL